MNNTNRTSQEAALSPDNPWPGPDVFSEASVDYFHGRAEETDMLARLLHRGIVTVLYGRSGMGKTSLLKAGLFPVARKQSILPVWIRLGFGKDDPPPEQQISAALIAALDECQITAPRPNKGESLWDYLHRKDLVFWTQDFRRTSLLLVFDQFEETFTLARQQHRDDFLRVLSDIATNNPPDDTRATPSRILALELERTPCRLLFCLREDFLPDLDGLEDLFPGLLDNKYRLQGMDDTQAKDVILGPGKHLLSEEVARQVLDYVAGESAGPLSSSAKYIEPVLLSVVLFELNLRRGTGQITPALLGDCRANILETFYDSAFRGLPDGAQRMVEDELLTKSDRRDTTAWENAAGYEGLSEAHIATLVDRHLLRREETAAGARVELIHDRLAEVAVQRRNSRRQREKEEQDRKEKEEAAKREREARKRQRLTYAIGCAIILVLSILSCVCWSLYASARSKLENARSKLENANIELESAKEARANAQNLEDLAERAKDKVDTFAKSLSLADGTTSADGVFRTLATATISYYEIPEVVNDLIKNPSTASLAMRGYLLLVRSVAGGTPDPLQKEADYSKTCDVLKTLAEQEYFDIQWLYSIALSWHGGSLIEIGRYDDALKTLEQCVSYGKKLLSERPEDEGLSYNLYVFRISTGDLLLTLNKTPEALSCYKEAMELAKNRASEVSTKASEDPNKKTCEWASRVLEISNKVCLALLALHQDQDALELYRDSVLALKNLKANDLSGDQWRGRLSDTERSIGVALALYAGDQKTRECLQRCLSEIMDQEQGPKDTDWRRGLAAMLRNEGDARTTLYEQEDPLKLYKESLEIMRKLVETDPEDPGLRCDLVGSLNRVGHAHLALNRPQDALISYTEALDLISRLADKNPNNLDWQCDRAICLNNVGDAQLALGKPQDAMTLYQESLEIMSKLVDGDSDSLNRKTNLAVSLSNTGDAFLALGQKDDARTKYKEAQRACEKTSPTQSAWYQELLGDFPSAQRIYELQPEDQKNEAGGLCMNYAHALLFTGEEDKAMELYIRHRGKGLGDGRRWNHEVASDFEKFRKLGITHPLMDEIEKALSQ